MPSPLVTIVSVFHNRGAEVERSVGSLLAQTYEPLEIIVVDDGSTDDTAARLNAIKDPRLSVRIQKNQGFTRAVDEAVRSAKGEYVAIHGSGDLSLPRRIEAQAKVLNENPSVGVVGCFIENENGQVKRLLKDQSPAQPLSYLEIVRTYPISHGEAMFRKAMFDRVGGYRAFFTFAQDHDLWLRMSRETNFWVVPELLYVRRQFANAVKTDPVKLMFQGYLGEFAEQCAKSWEPGKGDLLDRYGPSAIFLRTRSEKLSRKLNMVGLMQLADGDPAKGRMIIAASRSQSDSLITQVTALVADLSVKQPGLWEFLVRPMIRKAIARRVRIKATAAPKPVGAANQAAAT